MIEAARALELLREGNGRFARERVKRSNLSEKRREELAEGQEPFAVVLGCSDSRVPVESVFDQGLGDLFVVRVAGNILAATQAASIEFAVTNFGSQLVVVLGHTQCGAVKATADALSETVGESTNFIIKTLRPIVAPLVAEHGHDEAIDMAVMANVRSVAGSLRRDSAVLIDLIAAGKLLVVGAVYDLATGVVNFFDGAD